MPFSDIQLDKSLKRGCNNSKGKISNSNSYPGFYSFFLRGKFAEFFLRHFKRNGKRNPPVQLSEFCLKLFYSLGNPFVYYLRRHDTYKPLNPFGHVFCKRNADGFFRVITLGSRFVSYNVSLINLLCYFFKVFFVCCHFTAQTSVFLHLLSAGLLSGLGSAPDCVLLFPETKFCPASSFRKSASYFCNSP